jgi:hypothetical protein
MKKHILFIPAVLIMAACSKKNDPVPALLTPATAKAADLVGKWNVKADTIFSNTSNQFSVAPVTGNPYFQFNDDSTFTSGTASGGSQGIVFNYTVNNGTLVLTVPNYSGSETYSIYNITKNTLGLRLNNSNNTHEDAWLTK